jgi:hypothetical protein
MTQVLSTGMVGLAMGSGVPKLQPVFVQSGPPVFTGGIAVVGLTVQLGPVQPRAKRLTDPAGVGPSEMTEVPPPMLRPPQVRVLSTVPPALRVSPQVPPGVPFVKSRIVGPDPIVVVVVELVVVVVVVDVTGPVDVVVDVVDVVVVDGVDVVVVDGVDVVVVDGVVVLVVVVTVVLVVVVVAPALHVAG